MTDPDFEAGERYTVDELPQNQLKGSSQPEFLGDDLFALVTEDGVTIEFRRAYEVTCVYEIDEDGEIGDVHSGEKR